MSEYTIRTINNCKEIFGAIPLDDLAALVKLVPKGAVMNMRAAKHLGAVIVAGMPEDTDTLLKLPACEAIKVEVRIAKSKGMSEQAQKCLMCGERGTSSETMFAVFTGGEIKYPSHPHDPADLRRCRLLLEQVPEFAPRIGEMAAVSPQWAQLVAMWDVLCKTMDAECDWRNGKGNASKTYAMMKHL